MSRRRSLRRWKSEFFKLAMRDEPSRVPAVIIRIVPGPAVQRKSSATICGNACGIDAITVRGRSPRVPLAIVVDPCREQARVVCPGLGDCEATYQSLLRKGGGRVNEKMTHNERSRRDKNFHTLPPEGLKDFASAQSAEKISTLAQQSSASSVRPDLGWTSAYPAA